MRTAPASAATTPTAPSTPPSGSCARSARPRRPTRSRRPASNCGRISSEQVDSRVTNTSAAAEVGADNLLPWREVLAPHPDVASGNFHAAEFAADLAMVASNEGDSEYTDPVQFFARTFLTGGLRDLILRMARRMTGGPCAWPAG
ncbi:MAG TPA: hypothetical protein VIW24_07005 [Aldersonia sp.]